MKIHRYKAQRLSEKPGCDPSRATRAISNSFFDQNALGLFPTALTPSGSKTIYWMVGSTDTAVLDKTRGYENTKDWYSDGWLIANVVHESLHTLGGKFDGKPGDEYMKLQLGIPAALPSGKVTTKLADDCFKDAKIGN